MSLSANGSLRSCLVPVLTMRAVWLSVVYRPSYMAFRAVPNSSGMTSARNPSLPVLTPRMGMFFIPTRTAVLRNVPSPPIDMAKSASKRSSSNTSGDAEGICP